MSKIQTLLLSVLVAATALADDAIHIGQFNKWDDSGGNTYLYPVDPDVPDGRYHYDLGRNYSMSCWVREFTPKEGSGYFLVLMQGCWDCEGFTIEGTYNNSGTRQLDFATVHYQDGTRLVSSIQTAWTGDDMGVFDGQWHLLTVVCTAAENPLYCFGKFFIDGVLVASGEMWAVDFSVAADRSLCIGGYNNNCVCGCYMADVGLWNRALSDSEVQGLFMHRINPADTGLVAYWPFATDMKDAVANGATPHDCRSHMGSWADCSFYGEGENYGNFNRRTYADWVAGGSGQASGPASFTATLESREGGTNLTFGVFVEALGIGTTTFELLLGESAETLAPVEGVSASYAAGDAVVSFDLPVVSVPWNKTLYWAVRAASTDGEASYSAQSSVESFSTTDRASYYWRDDVAEGDWDDPANWSPSDAACFGYPNSEASRVYITRTGPTVIHVSGTVFCTLGDNGDFSTCCRSSTLSLVGDRARTDNRIAATGVGGLLENQQLVLDNIVLRWWDYQPRTTGGRIVFAGRNTHTDFGGVTALLYGDVDIGFRIPAEGYAEPPFVSIYPLGRFLIGESWTPTLPEGRFMRVSVEPDSPLLKVTGRRMRVKLADGVVAEAARAHIVCTAPQKGESSFEVLDDGIYFNYYNRPGFVVFIR